ncbi:hypothetical protein ES708_23901 [subsurface metagenome]
MDRQQVNKTAETSGGWISRIIGRFLPPVAERVVAKYIAGGCSRHKRIHAKSLWLPRAERRMGNI